MSAYPLVLKAKDQIRGMVRRIIFQPGIRDKYVSNLLRNPETREWLIHRIAVYEAWQRSEFDQASLDNLSDIRGFEDCYWLFSSNELNQSLSQLRFDDAAYLYHQLLNHEQPRIAELGRYKGGTTFLLAAAGAQVLSLEYDKGIHERYLKPLTEALEHFGLADRVDAVLGDAYAYDPGEEAFDFVLVHCSPPSYEKTRALVERWWPSVRVGGFLILHATSFLPGELQFIEEMRNSPEAWHAEVEPNTPGENVYFRRLA